MLYLLYLKVWNQFLKTFYYYSFSFEHQINLSKCRYRKCILKRYQLTTTTENYLSAFMIIYMFRYIYNYMCVPSRIRQKNLTGENALLPHLFYHTFKKATRSNAKYIVLNIKKIANAEEGNYYNNQKHI